MSTDMLKPASTRPGAAGALAPPFRHTGVWKIYAATAGLYGISGIMQPQFFSADHLIQLLVISSFLGILAMGQTLVILTGGIDLSVAYMLNLGAVIMTQAASDYGGGTAAIIMVAAGIAVGALNGLGVAYLKISPIIMTLAMSSILKSVTYVYTDGNPKGAAPDWLRYLGTGSVFGIKLALLVWLVFAAAIVLLLGKTTFGRKVYAIGTNPTVSHLSGIHNKRVLVLVYTLSGLFAVLAGMMSVGFYGLSFLGMGDTLLLPSIAAVVIGGTSIMGGRGGYAGTIAGAVILYILMSILTLLDMRDAGKQIIYGLVILVVLFLYGRAKTARS
ncbi:ABC transporter permease [Paenibacillus vulneris]|uniref:ABC transporter permease n=1 Tax=Paenibacillus vulneris TaxID=1133364 RepID=A0ABW3UTV9_9BACL